MARLARRDGVSPLPLPPAISSEPVTQAGCAIHFALSCGKRSRKPALNLPKWTCISATGLCLETCGIPRRRPERSVSQLLRLRMRLCPSPGQVKRIPDQLLRFRQPFQRLLNRPAAPLQHFLCAAQGILRLGHAKHTHRTICIRTSLSSPPYLDIPWAHSNIEVGCKASSRGYPAET